jgi:hypothetical protein
VLRTQRVPRLRDYFETHRHGPPAVRFAGNASGALLGVVLLLCAGGCGGGSSQGASATRQAGGASSTPTTTTPVCPNPDGGDCVGLLKAGTYKTVRFQPSLMYTVPGGGWANMEDNPVSFTLAPPGVPVRQAQAATNIIIVWPGVEAAAMNCSGGPDTNITTPKAIAHWLTHHVAVTATPPRPVGVGGLNGYVVSVRLAARGGVRCGAPFRNVPLLNNVADPQAQYAIGGPSDHALIYLLNMQGDTLGIIADSTNPQRPSLAADANVIQHLSFPTS